MSLAARIPRIHARLHPAVSPPRLPPAARRARLAPWARALPPGRLPAYDHALRYIRADAHTLRAELAALKAAYAQRAAADARAGTPHDPAARRRYLDRRALLAVQAEVNLPEVRAAFRSGRFPFARPVFRHLTEQKWRTAGALDLLMERLHQMHVIPDVLPALHPSLDLRVQVPTAPDGGGPRGFVPVTPGAFLRPVQTLAPPRLAATVFHPEQRLYTLLLLDPDVPHTPSRSFQTYLHWLHPNIPLAGTHRVALLPPCAAGRRGGAALAYVPPHPQRGTPYHRYVLLLLPQPGGAPLVLPDGEALRRAPFDVRGFCAEHGLDPARGGGAHVWRAVWEESVSGVFRDVLGAREPVYGVLRA